MIETKTKRIAPLLLAAAALTAGLAAVAARQTPPAPAPAAVVRMDDYAFTPSTVTIRAGETVEWVNDSPIVHTVTADPSFADDPSHVVLPKGARPFGSDELQPRNTFRHAFTVPGTYQYICIPHEQMGMTGQVVVKPVQ